VEAAKETRADDSEERFNTTLKDLASRPVRRTNQPRTNPAKKPSSNT